MSPATNEPCSRRDFFRRAGRHGVLALLGLGGVALSRRRGDADSSQVCVNKSVCCQCGEFSRCRLPAALSAKQAEQGAP